MVVSDQSTEQKPRRSARFFTLSVNLPVKRPIMENGSRNTTPLIIPKYCLSPGMD